MSEHIFAYGSNMCLERLRLYNVNPLSAGQAAQLAGYVIQFNKRSTDGSGKANLVPCDNKTTWGVLYMVTRQDLKSLNEGEKGYTAKQLNIIGPSGNVQAWVYIADMDQTTSGLQPYSWYKRFLVDGARFHQLPKEYVSELEAIEALEEFESTKGPATAEHSM